MAAVTTLVYNRAWSRIGCCTVTICLIAGQLEEARADDSTAQSTLSGSVSFQWLNDTHSGGVPQNVEISVDVDYDGTCLGEQPWCDPPDVAWELIIYDCQKNEILRLEKSYVVNCGTQSTRVFKKKIGICGRIPRYYKLKTLDGIRIKPHGGSCSGDAVWTDPSDLPIALPTIGCANRAAYGSDWEAFKQDLDCLACVGQSEIPDRGAVAPHDGFIFYKTKRDGRYTLYTQSGTPDGFLASDGRHGEMVRGLFQPSEDGFLLVEVKDSTVGLVEMVGMVGPDDCLSLSENESFTFDVRTGRGEPQGGLEVLLDWFWWERDPATNSECCLRHEYKRLALEVEPMCPALVNPLIPERARLTRGSSEAPGESSVVATELRIPACGTRRCPQGNLTRWFVLWPELEEGGTAPEGFAKGWKIIGNLLIPPWGTEDQAYEFAD